MTVIAKVSAILDAFTADDRGVGFAELQRRTGLPKATLHRLTGELVDARLLDRVDGKFHLSSHLFTCSRWPRRSSRICTSGPTRPCTSGCEREPRWSM
jgi:DNA-binding IclR family transcriptional regulator